MGARAGFPTSPEKRRVSVAFAADDMCVMSRRRVSKPRLPLYLIDTYPIAGRSLCSSEYCRGYFAEQRRGVEFVAEFNELSGQKFAPLHAA